MIHHYLKKVSLKLILKENYITKVSFFHRMDKIPPEARGGLFEKTVPLDPLQKFLYRVFQEKKREKCYYKNLLGYFDTKNIDTKIK